VWLERLGVQTLFIEPGSPWANGYVESFNGKLRDELLDREIFYTVAEAKVLLERWRREYNTIRPHSALGYRPPAPVTIAPLPTAFATLNPPAMALGLT
jgi:transposase InsO family protein